ncbi:hypothetical protein [Pseudodesulfovibrio sp.]|uniref:hypothetical protein n=1 Tax=Pseudodesulfovibrio sp. TaxID=2035812 RepID=UPI0026391647|nr:hypothetical protein [Pseudodesulfovibrio sp.]MDD3310611.1 hypothetical protein [Pseudodesulfovibrio sp.]
MKSKVLTLLLGCCALLLGLAPLPARAEEPLDLMTYYRNPRPGLLPDYLHDMSLDPALNEDAADLYAVFLAAALNQSPIDAQAALDKASTLPQDKSVLALKTAWLMNDRPGRAFLRQAAERGWPDAADMLRTPPPDFRNPQRLDAFYLDCMWVTFFATGRDWPVLKVVSALDVDPKSVDDGVLRTAAAWSLKSNAGNHPRVLAILREVRQTASPRLAAQLDEILSKK